MKTRNNLDTYVVKLEWRTRDVILKAPENRLRSAALFVALGIAVSAFSVRPPSEAQETPWKRRIRKGVVLNDARALEARGLREPLTADEMRRLALRPRGAGLVDLARWPDEPPSPAVVAPTELAGALASICPADLEREDLDRYARAVVRYSAEFSVDPWLLAALVYTQSECDASASSSYGTGLTLLNAGMHARHIHDGVYRYGVRTSEGWSRRELDVSAFEYRSEALKTPEANLYFAAAFLRVFQDQCPAIDHAFDSSSHRHAVSHFIWGDEVGDTGPEDRILTARRRLLNSHAQTRRGVRPIGNISFVSPLDGYPRVVTSGLGEPRDGGRRPHRGIDFASDFGEPVRAVAAGAVVFAGVDWERRAHIPLAPWGAPLVHERHMGPRGIFVEVDHGDGVVSLYAHLADYDVQVGERVDAGQRLGRVGRSGVRDSGPHLHLGLFRSGEVLDPLAYLGAYVFPPELTKRGRTEVARRPMHAKKRRRARRRALSL